MCKQLRSVAFSPLHAQCSNRHAKPMSLFFWCSLNKAFRKSCLRPWCHSTWADFWWKMVENSFQERAWLDYSSCLPATSPGRYIYICKYIHICKNIYTYIYIYIYTYAYISWIAHRASQLPAPVDMYIYAHMYIFTSMYVYIFTYTFICIYT